MLKLKDTSFFIYIIHTSFYSLNTMLCCASSISMFTYAFISPARWYFADFAIILLINVPDRGGTLHVFRRRIHGHGLYLSVNLCVHQVMLLFMK